MSNDDYEYRGLMASSWDFLRGDASDFPDRGLYREIISSSGEPILDVGCGTGRLLLEYRKEGLDADGVDISPEMLDLCRRNAGNLSLNATLINQGMEALDLPRQYRTIIVPSASFQLVPDLNLAKNALDGFFEHLADDGTLVISIWHFQDRGIAEWGDWWMVVEKEGFENSRTIRKWERSMHDSTTQLRHTETRYELVQNGEVVFTQLSQRSPEMRNYTPEQLRTMFEAAGFSNIQAVSGFSREPATEDDDVFCMLAKKSSAPTQIRA